MDRREATDFLHKTKGYSRRLSAKLVEIAMLQKSNSVIAFALKEAIEKAKAKHKSKPDAKFVIKGK